ncbi:MAG: hypothetical protein A3K19_09885 [Lentisphaerae bacterium RIFOXYB12_FULL_65_16]|nr:MAG: hypothetical protein A3K18_00620 [Lentisphaerae bacterium RIFOXYA12_64_32]OGV91263.1 MAG: hypothetical protein A3K19_09885 [Lentisphaerae bacterium RIFOXYB12_FULL_65_16]
MARRFLFVDDSATVRAFLKRLVRIAGYTEEKIVEAENGADAIKRLKEQSFDLVVTDLHMPVMTGIQLVKIMGVSPELRRIPVIVLSSDGSELRIEELKKAGASLFLRKPCTPETIRDALVHTLGEKPEPPAAPGTT